MPQQMTLTLKLANVARLMQSIKALNDALNKLNRAFGTTANSVNKSAQRLNNAANNLKKAAQGFNRPRLPRSPGGNPNNPNRPGQTTGYGSGDIYSQLFSIFSGNGRYAFSKALLNTLKSLTDNHMAKVSANAGGGAAGQAAVDSLLGKIVKFGKTLGLVIIAIGIMVIAIKGLVALLNYIASNFRSQMELFRNIGSSSAYGQLKGVQRLLNMSNEDIASATKNDPSMGRITANKLRLLKSIKNDETASRYARANNLEGFMKIRDYSDEQFNRAMSQNEKPISPMNRRIMSHFDEALGNFQRSWDYFIQSLIPLMLMVTGMVNAAATFIDLMTGRTLIDLINGDKKGEDKLNKAADKFGKAVDTFSDKTGTIGGGQRARGAFPNSWHWYGNMEDSIKNNINNGAFAL